MYIRLLNHVGNQTNTTSVISKLDTFSPFTSLIILLLLLPSNFIALGNTPSQF